MKRLAPLALILALSLACKEAPKFEANGKKITHYGVERFEDADIYTFRCNSVLKERDVRHFAKPGFEIKFKSWQYVDTHGYFLTQFLVRKVNESN